MSDRYRIAVIGRGLTGSAAARHLSISSPDVALIGPSEPASRPDHQGVFGSHYDEGRITRALDSDPVWARLSQASIARYAEIEAQSGISFFSPVGSMMGCAQGSDRSDAISQVLAATGAECQILDHAALTRKFPYFAFDEDSVGFYEPDTGYISPRRLVAAQTGAAELNGATVIDDHATAIDETGSGVTITTSDGNRINADHVLVATGGYTGKNDLVPRPVTLRVVARTILFAEVSEDAARELRGMPTLIPGRQDMDSIYLLPPIRYPDGRIYIKIGGDPLDTALPDADAISDWFRSDGKPEGAAYLRERLARLIPNLDLSRCHQQSCVTSWTVSGYPIIAHASQRITVLTGGNGAGAKCSDELGRLGAMRARGEEIDTYGVSFAFEGAA